MSIRTDVPARTPPWAYAGAGGLLLAGLTGCLGPTAPPTPTSETTRPAAVSTATQPGRAPTRPGAVRPGSALPAPSATADPASGELVVPDGPDAVEAEVDIRTVRGPNLAAGARASWTLELAGEYPSAGTLTSQGRVIAYGIVVDSDGDHEPDCELGLNNDAPRSGAFRVWLRNTRTGAADERVGGPYGFPFDFSHPGEPSSPRRSMHFFFLTGAATTPCEPFGPSSGFYAWAAELRGGKVTTVDYAPDTAWQPMGQSVLFAPGAGP